MHKKSVKTSKQNDTMSKITNISINNELAELDLDSDLNTSYQTMLQNSYDISKYQPKQINDQPDASSSSSRQKNDCFTLNINKLSQNLECIPFHKVLLDQTDSNLSYYFEKDLLDQFTQEASDNTNRKQNNKLTILNNFEYLNINPKISIDTKITDKTTCNIQSKENETINDWLDDLLN